MGRIACIPYATFLNTHLVLHVLLQGCEALKSAPLRPTLAVSYSVSKRIR